MAGSARPTSIPVGLAFAVWMVGFASDPLRAENSGDAGLVLGGLVAPAPGPAPDDALARALELPPSHGPVAHVPMPRSRALALVDADEAGMAESPAMAGLRVAVPLPRQRHDGGDALADQALTDKALADPAAQAEAPAPRVEAPLPQSRPAVVASLGPAPGAEAPASLPIFASGPAAETAGGIRSLIARHASANGIPFGLADAVVRVESRYNPHARNGANIGLMQISLPTARSLGYGGPAAGLSDAETNLTYGVRYLAQAYRMADGDTCRTILKYQGGHRAVSMTSAARSYCDKVRMHAANLR